MILNASICTRGGKVVVSRSFREISRSRIEALLASFPKLATSGSQHTVVEANSVRYVWQPLDELYLVLITNLGSNILQDIDSLHLYAQVVTSICKSLDEREILKHAFDLLSAFDELVTQGYRENLTLSQIKTFLEMESHEERIQEIIARNKELEATEERKRKAKQLEMQRKEVARSSRGMGGAGAIRPQAYPTYTPPTQTVNVPDTYDSYNAAKSAKSMPLRGKGMQLGKKTKSGNAFDQLRSELGSDAEASSPLVAPVVQSPKAAPAASSASTSSDREGLHIVLAEQISATLSKEGTLEGMEIKGDLQLRITDPSLTQVKLNITQGNTRGATLMSHPKVDKALFKKESIIQMSETGKGFPVNQTIGVMRWKVSPKVADIEDPPLTFTVWVNDNGGNTWNITVEYEWTGGDALKDVLVTIPYQTSEPSVSSFDAIYEVSGDSIDWTIGNVDEESPSGSFEFEAQASDDAEFFPMSIHFNKTRPFVEVDVASVTLLGVGQDINFSKEVKSSADKYNIG
ncbi:hypothetical protein BLS_007223 [Venturia inaequalis]|uniref:Coatomer subunit delta n=1 Tax=Venturia inaequalis TaxID=5025 RepID=A0A8H3UAN4_VENIN|nr:hypothetical protein BLS_007223 [Venturia inaequalis]KAE9971679.1 hypothetical protein EG328_005453 [Venturia inaequalis]KAE9992817.1 hypothetical protein EG327_007586 [Venturia inaequalis]RDI83175.1 Palmitoyltransferase [Venturia inaequalis]